MPRKPPASAVPNGRIIVYIKFEKVYKKEMVVFFMILSQKTEGNV
jgi:hypothetical protein